MGGEQTNGDEPELVGLMALGWILSEGGRAERLLAVTGLTPERLREAAGERTLLASVLAFLEAHEPDLIECAQATGRSPAELVRCRAALER